MRKDVGEHDDLAMVDDDPLAAHLAKQTARAAEAAAARERPVRPAPEDPRLTALFRSFVSRLSHETAHRIWRDEWVVETVNEKVGWFRTRPTQVRRQAGQEIARGWFVDVHGREIETAPERWNAPASTGKLGLAVTTDARPLLVLRNGAMLTVTFDRPLPNRVTLGEPLGQTMCEGIFSGLDLYMGNLPGHQVVTRSLPGIYPLQNEAVGDPNELMPGYLAERLALALHEMGITS